MRPLVTVFDRPALSNALLPMPAANFNKQTPIASHEPALTGLRHLAKSLAITHVTNRRMWKSPAE
jgi:hypothetical protein